MKTKKEYLQEFLALTDEEMKKLKYTIDEDKSKEGEHRGYWVEFDATKSATEILSKIKELEVGCRLHLNPHFFES